MGKSWFWGRGWRQQFFNFRVRRFSEWPEPLHWVAFPVGILTKPLIHWTASPFSLKNPFFQWKVLRRIPFPKAPLNIGGGVQNVWGGAKSTTRKLVETTIPDGAFPAIKKISQFSETHSSKHFPDPLYPALCLHCNRNSKTFAVQMNFYLFQ